MVLHSHKYSYIPQWYFILCTWSWYLLSDLTAEVKRGPKRNLISSLKFTVKEGIKSRTADCISDLHLCSTLWARWVFLDPLMYAPYVVLVEAGENLKLVIVLEFTLTDRTLFYGILIFPSTGTITIAIRVCINSTSEHLSR